MIILAIPALIALEAHTARAADRVRIFTPHSERDQRHLHNNAVLTAALEQTVPTHGEYELVMTLRGSQRERALVELIAGQLINVHIVPTRLVWETKTLPIRIPIAKGLLGYRLFLIKRQDLVNFADINSLNELKKLRAGLRQQWSTTLAMQAIGFEVMTGRNYEGLFRIRAVSDARSRAIRLFSPRRQRDLCGIRSPPPKPAGDGHRTLLIRAMLQGMILERPISGQPEPRAVSG